MIKLYIPDHNDKFILKKDWAILLSSRSNKNYLWSYLVDKANISGQHTTVIFRANSIFCVKNIGRRVDGRKECHFCIIEGSAGEVTFIEPQLGINTRKFLINLKVEELNSAVAEII